VEPGKNGINQKIIINMKKNFLITTGLLLAGTIISCNSGSKSETAKTDSTMNNSKISPDTAKGEWKKLFDGKSQAGWHGYNKTGELKNWAVEDGALVCLGAAPDAHGGDIVSDNEYENFEFSWDWKMTKGGNSGVMYHVIETARYQAPWETGPEYQLIDDIDFPEKLEESQKSAADYAMYAPNDKKKLKPVGEWNSSKIVFNKGHVEHWLNGEKVVEFEAWSDDWNKRKAAGKWKEYPDYGMAKKGKIALQDHGKKVYFRNIMIMEYSH
jgi:hypothetical protein